MIPGLLGKKLGMSTVFDQEGNAIPVTLLEVGPCVVIQVKTPERDGYYAVQLGFDEKKPKRTTKPLLGHFQKAQTTPKRFVREIRLSEDFSEELKPGQPIKLDEVFKPGDYVDVIGWSKGRGFQGVVKRWGFAGAPAGHGTHEYFRHGGSIGASALPGRVFKGKKMPGHYGVERVTAQNLKVIEVRAEENLLVVKGSVPGAKGSYLIIKQAVKKPRREEPEAQNPAEQTTSG